jgi:IS30 family transposase
LFDKWLLSAKVEKKYETLASLIIREQFLKRCHPDLCAYLREKKLTDANELAKTTLRYLDAHGGTMYESKPVAKRKEQMLKSKPDGNKANFAKHDLDKPVCGICKKGNHKDNECWFKDKGTFSGGNQGGQNKGRRCFQCNSLDHVIKDCPEKNEFGSVAVEVGNGKRQCKCVGIHSASACIREVLRDLPNLEGVSNVVQTNGETHVVHGCECDEDVNICTCLHLPISEGMVNGVIVKMMRDTGCSSVIVRSDLVKPNQYTGHFKDCMLIDGTVRRLPVAEIDVNCQYYIGKTEALVVRTPVFDLIIGNVCKPVDRHVVNSNSECEDSCVQDVEIVNESNEVEHAECDNLSGCGDSFDENANSENKLEKLGKCEVDTNTGIGAGVVTRSQAKAGKEPMKPLTVPPSELVDKDILMKNQKEDESLRKYWNLVGIQKARETKSGVVKFEVKHGILYRTFSPSSGEAYVKQVVVPEQQRQKVLLIAHDGLMSGHCGIRRTTERVLSNFYWPGVNSDVRRYCKSCDICQKTVQKGRQGVAPLISMPVISEPFRRVAVDLIGPIVPCSDRGHRYIVTVIDYATRYPEAIPLKKIDTISVAEAMIEIFTRLGFPEELLSDRGSQFMSEIMKEVERLLSIHHLATTPYHPQCNGLVERFNGTLKTILKKLTWECPKQWDRYLPAVLYAYRSTVQESTGFSPFELMLGRKVRGPLEILKMYWTKEEREVEERPIYQYVVELRQRLQETCRIAQEELCKAKETQKMYFDRKAKPKSLEIGSKVLLLLPVKKNKLLLHWKGPYVVQEKMSPVNYRIKVGKKLKNFHVNMLKAYTERSNTKSVKQPVAQPIEVASEIGSDDDVECANSALVIKDGVMKNLES